MRKDTSTNLATYMWLVADSRQDVLRLDVQIRGHDDNGDDDGNESLP